MIPGEEDFRNSDGPPGISAPQDLVRFYNVRRRIYSGLLLFVVAVGLPIIGIPPLRHRLSGRVQALKTAMAGEVTPVTLKVGENQAPFPAEYEKNAPPLPVAPQVPLINKIFAASGGNIPQSAPRSPAHPRAERPEVPPPSSASSEKPAEQEAHETAAADEPQYTQGKIERDAYELLLQSSPAAAGMVQGSDPSLRFKSWDAAKRGEDTYWVRLRFQSADDPDVIYIWRVMLQANQVAPWNYNARSISQR